MLESGFTGGYVRTSVGDVHYLETGSGTTPVLMLHQGGSSSREGVAVAGHLRDHRVVLPDLPGHGASSRLPDASIEDYARGVVELVEALGLESPVLFGHHFGGVVAVETAVRLSDRVRHLILSNTPFVDAPARARRTGEAPRSLVVTRDDGSHLAELWRSRSELFQNDASLVNRYIAENLLLGDEVEHAHAAVARYRMEDRFPGYAGPVTYLHGEADPYIAVEVDEALQGFAPERVVQLDAGIGLVDQRAEEVAEAIRSA